MNLKSIAVFSLVFFCHTAFAQQPESHTIKVLSHVKDKQVLLRWAPADHTVWQLGNKYGYTVERFELNTNGALLWPVPVVLHSGIKPFSEETFEKLAAANDDASVLGELIYGHEEPVQKMGPAELLQKQDDLNNRFGMALLVCDLSPGMARAAGLFLSDSTAKDGARYIYKISIANGPQKIKIVPGIIVVDVVNTKPLQPFTDLVATFADRTVTLSWPLMLHRGIYSAYQVERYDEAQKQFKSITDLPYIPMNESASAEQASFVDSLASNTAQYQYRVRGITPFGETGPPSNIVMGTGKDNLSGLVVITQAQSEKNKVVIRWEFPPGFESKIGGFIVSQSVSADGPYQVVTRNALPPKTREFSDAAPVRSNYYQVRAIDREGGELSHSYPYFVHIEDNTPPAIPAGLAGKVDSTGLVTLTWKENTDTDLLGYRLFSADDNRQEFVEVTKQIVAKTTFHDTIAINVLNKNIFYKIVAVDLNYNTSEYSGSVKLSKPDKIKPATPVFTKTDWNKTEVVLSWINSSSQDIARHVLFRTDKEDSTRSQQLLTWPAGQPRMSYTDNTAAQGKKYRYTIQAYDSAGNFSAAISKEIVAESGLRTAVTDLTATIDRGKKSITLRWKYDEPFAKVNIYRRKNDEAFSLYQSLSDTPQEFADSNVVINNTYSYKIQLVLTKKAKTRLSKELKVPF